MQKVYLNAMPLECRT